LEFAYPFRKAFPSTEDLYYSAWNAVFVGYIMGGPTPESLARPGTELAHQTALMCWASLNTHKFPELEYLFHIPNGGTRNAVEAGFLKASGVRRGVPDLMLPVPRWGKHGLWIEMKVGTNELSEHQQKWIQVLKAMEYAVVVCHSWITASAYITQYLEGDPNDKTGICN
jgi:hypothetical protein